MSTWKTAPESAEKPRVDNPVPESTPVRPRDVELVSLEVDLEPEAGGDPYNSTGKHLVERLRDLEE